MDVDPGRGARDLPTAGRIDVSSDEYRAARYIETAPARRMIMCVGETPAL